MLVYFTDAVTQNKFAVNPEYVVGVFVANDEEHKGKTVLNLLNGSFLIEESQLDAVGQLQGELK
jgi:hypothetical protein